MLATEANVATVRQPCPTDVISEEFDGGVARCLRPVAHPDVPSLPRAESPRPDVPSRQERKYLKNASGSDLMYDYVRIVDPFDNGVGNA